MNKTAIKNYAVWARKDLIDRVKRKAYEYEVTDSNLLDETLDIVHGKPLNKDEKKQRQDLIHDVKEKGFDHVMEEVAYTWFNRFIALRFMEVNNYLPKRIRIFTNENNEFKPQIIDEAMNIELEGLNKNEVYELLQSNNQSELYKKLLIAICNDMGNYLPGMFTKINDYRVLLFPDNLLNPDSVLGQLISDIEEGSFNVQKEGQVEIIGWFYQFYNTDPKAKVFARPKGQKITKVEIPAATQLFTPDWIVRYMVENSVGRFWLDGHFESNLKSNWKYYLDEAKQEPEVEEKLNLIRNEYKTYSPEMIKVMDPCMGSGHILVYAFDVLMDIYKECGYSERDAALSIIKNNLYGLDIDERAYQLSYFAVMMKARQYNRKILKTDIDGKKVEPNLTYIQNSNKLNDDVLNRLGNLKNVATRLIYDFEYAEELGSVIKENYSLDELQKLEEKVEQLDKEKDISNMFDILDVYSLSDTLIPLIKQAKLLSQKYCITVTNPPYLSARGGMNSILSTYLHKNYPISKNDLFTVFMEVCNEMLVCNGIYSMINQQSWMFLSGFQKLREKIYKTNSILNLIHLGAGAFDGIAGEVVQSVSFSIRKSYQPDYYGNYIDVTNSKWKNCLSGFGDLENVYKISINELEDIPNKILCYHLGGEAIRKYYIGKRLDTFADPRVGMATGDNEKFVRLWHEVGFNKVGIGYKKGIDTVGQPVKWFPYNKGGEYRRWYGNRTHLVDWENDGHNITSFKQERLLKGEIEKKNSECWNREYYFLESISWSKVSSSRFAVRYYESGFIFDVAGCSILGLKDNLFYVMGALNSQLRYAYIESLSPTLNFETGAIKAFPIIRSEEQQSRVTAIVKKCINTEKVDWDSFETSWDFTLHPLVKNKVSSIKEAYSLWEKECDDRFNELKANEEELNRIFIDIYGLQDELTLEVEDKDVTVRKADLERDIKSFISYAVGCMFGRYSLDVEGLAYAGGQWGSSKYTSFIPDKDNIIPICDDEYFDDDIVGRFVKFVKTVYGKDTLEENLSFIANALGGKGTSREVIRNYFLNEFYKDHCKVYQKRPIYWLFDSGKKNGFKALIYIHRYSSDLIARLRTQYVFEQQSCYRNQIEMMQSQLDGELSSSEKVKLNKKLKSLREQDEELRCYEEKVHHFADFNREKLEIDLDDGVKVNYDKFKELLAKVK